MTVWALDIETKNEDISDLAFTNPKGWEISCICLYNSDNQYFHFTMSTVNLNASSATLSQSHGGGAYKESGSENDPINGLQFYFASGNISSGKITLYGRAT